jgi:hypothetical protein
VASPTRFPLGVDHIAERGSQRQFALWSFDNALTIVAMSTVAFGCLFLAASALAMCCAAWYSRFFPGGSGEPNQSGGRFRRPLALAALLCATSSAVIYVAFPLLWAY